MKTKNNIFSSRLFDNTNFYKIFEKDLRHAKQAIIIESPFITLKRMHVILPTLINLRRRNVSIIVNTRNPEEHDEEYSRQAIDAIAMMQEIGIRVLYTVKLHRKLAIIDEEILWEGSLNILSQNDSCEIMRRSVSGELAKEVCLFIGINSWHS